MSVEFVVVHNVIDCVELGKCDGRLGVVAYDLSAGSEAVDTLLQVFARLYPSVTLICFPERPQNRVQHHLNELHE